MPSELLILLFACMLQATLTLIDPGWIYQFKNFKMHTLWHSEQCNMPHSSDACFAGDLTALIPSCPLWLHHCHLGHWVQLQLQFRREVLSPTEWLGNS